jgi:hypothetical protein
VWFTFLNVPVFGNEEEVVILTGCLTEDAESNMFTLIEESGRHVSVAGVPELKKHINQRVGIEGTSSSDGRVFLAVVVKRLSPACAPRAERPEEATADQQGNNPADRRVAQLIRQALVADKALSIFAHNVQVISRDGVVTLKGLVKSESEKDAVEEKARAVVGAERVRSELSAERNVTVQSDH